MILFILEFAKVLLGVKTDNFVVSFKTWNIVDFISTIVLSYLIDDPVVCLMSSGGTPSSSSVSATLLFLGAIPCPCLICAPPTGTETIHSLYC